MNFLFFLLLFNILNDKEVQNIIYDSSVEIMKYKNYRLSENINKAQNVFNIYVSHYKNDLYIFEFENIDVKNNILLKNNFKVGKITDDSEIFQIITELFYYGAEETTRTTNAFINIEINTKNTDIVKKIVIKDDVIVQKNNEKNNYFKDFYLNYYFNSFYTLKESAKEDKNNNSFENNELFFGIKSKFNKINYNFGMNINDFEKKYNTNMKVASLSIELLKNFFIETGIVENTFNHFLNNFWEYLYISKNPLEHLTLTHFSDSGLNFKYQNKFLLFSFGLFNGNGYNHLNDTDKNKDFVSSFVLNFNNFYIGGYLNYIIVIENVNSENYYDKYKNNFFTTSFLGYKNKLITIGYQYLFKYDEYDSEEDIEKKFGHCFYLNLKYKKFGFNSKYFYWNQNLGNVLDKNYDILFGFNYDVWENFSVSTNLNIKWIGDFDKSVIGLINILFKL